MKLRVLLLVFVCAFANSEDGWIDISSAIVKDNECSSEAKFEDLFSLSISPVGSGVAQIQYLSEANEESFFNCPESFLFVIAQLAPDDQSAVLDNFGVVSPPWEIGEKLKPFVAHKLYGVFIKSKLGAYLSAKKP